MKTNVKKITSYKTDDNHIFDTFEEALGHECETTFDTWYNNNISNTLLINNVTVPSRILFIWLYNNKDILKEFLIKLENTEF